MEIWTHNTCPYQAQHPDASEWIQSYWGGQWGSIHVLSQEKRKGNFFSNPPLKKQKTVTINRHSDIQSKQEGVLWEVCGLLTLKMALTFLWGNHCHVYWCPPSHNALPRACLSAPQSSSTLATGGEQKGEAKKKKMKDHEQKNAWNRVQVSGDLSSDNWCHKFDGKPLVDHFGCRSLIKMFAR